jgi:hypothetical protein
MISSYFNLPFGGWAYCQFPSVTGTASYLGKIKNGRDLLVWFGRFEFVIGRSKNERRRAGPVSRDPDGTNSLGCPPTERLYRTLRDYSPYRG